MRFAVFYIALCFSVLAFSQSVDEKLAAQFFDNEEYEKAEYVYKKLYKKNPKSVYIYENYLNTLLVLKREKDATKLVNRQISRNSGQLNFQVDLGYIYLQFDKKEDAEKYFEKLTRSYANNRGNVVFLAQSYNRRGLTNESIKALEKGARQLGILVFYRELSQAYRSTNNTKKLTDITLEALLLDAGIFDYATKMLDIVFDKKEDATYLKSKALQYAQKNPSNQVYDELLLEVFLQQKKYTAALRQTTSLDKRNSNQGTRVLQLANLCVKNKAYAVAIDAYSYVINLGESAPTYDAGKNGLINALYLKTTGSLVPDTLEVASLIGKIQTYLDSKGITHTTAKSQFRLAELHIFYTNNVHAGIRLLEEIIQTPRLRASFVAESKLLLGDAYLITNNIWDAKLMYGQVDKQFKEDALGQEAKFKNAKLSYYTGDFDWAKGQLDILKTATTQLISNNAIELSLLIQDNTGLDTTEEAMKKYAAAEFYLFQNKIEKCTEILTMLPFTYPDHTLKDEIFYLKARVQEKQGNYEAANKLYTTIYEKYSEDILADNALYRSAYITLFILDDKEKAQVLFEKLVLEYNTSLFAVDARKMYFALKEGKTKSDLLFESSI
ncbi:MAG: hypothetical protein P8N47_00960 [Bacteroidia bacterium]|jgi:predicted Zn-dependent protease|nr:hypothetical protein [Bacteroidia bacterium]